jgi:hypothetical protein
VTAVRASANLSNSGKGAQQKKRQPVPGEVEPEVDFREASYPGLVDAIISIGKERQKILSAMKQALLRGDDEEALERAREMTGLPTKRASVETPKLSKNAAVPSAGAATRLARSPNR